MRAQKDTCNNKRRRQVQKQQGARRYIQTHGSARRHMQKPQQRERELLAGKRVEMKGWVRTAPHFLSTFLQFTAECVSAKDVSSLWRTLFFIVIV